MWNNLFIVCSLGVNKIKVPDVFRPFPRITIGRVSFDKSYSIAVVSVANYSALGRLCMKSNLRQQRIISAYHCSMRHRRNYQDVRLSAGMNKTLFQQPTASISLAFGLLLADLGPWCHAIMQRSYTQLGIEYVIHPKYHADMAVYLHVGGRFNAP